MLGSLIDTVMDLTVLPGYTKLGFGVRRRAWEDRPPGDLHGKTVMVSGATSGLGLAAAEGFARLGARLILLSRDRGRGEKACEQIRSGSPEVQVELAMCDLGELRSVRAFAQRFTAAGEQLDVLVNNAGVMCAERTLSGDGIELTFATNVLGPFLLTNLLVGALERNSGGRIINVSSGGMYAQRLHVEDLQMVEEKFDGTTAYARTKRAQVVLTELWAQRLAERGVTCNSMHPGWADTPGLADSLPGFYKLTRRALRSAAEGADTIVWLGAAPAEQTGTGGFWHDRRRRPTHRLPLTHETERDRLTLWEECARLSGWHEPGAAPGNGGPVRVR